MNSNIPIGSKAKDRISGFVGIVVAITYWLNGCVRITIAPQELREGKPIESQTFDQEQVQLVELPAIAAPTVQIGGPSIAPKRIADPR